MSEENILTCATSGELNLILCLIPEHNKLLYNIISKKISSQPCLPFKSTFEAFHVDFPGKNSGFGSHCLLQGSNPGILHYRWILCLLSHQGSPQNKVW